MRKLSPQFINNLTNGFLAPLRHKVLVDNDLDLQIRIFYSGFAMWEQNLQNVSTSPSDEG